MLCATAFTTMATKRKAAIDRYLWQAATERFADWDLSTRKPTAGMTAPMLQPLCVGHASLAQAHAVAATVHRSPLAEEGLGTTTLTTDQQ